MRAIQFLKRVLEREGGDSLVRHGQRLPGVAVTTPMLTGGTDRPIYRALGIITSASIPSSPRRATSRRASTATMSA